MDSDCKGSETDFKSVTGSFLLSKTMELALLLALALLLVREVLAYRERREMLDRLMAKNLPEYKDNHTPTPNQLDNEPDDSVPLEDAENDLTDTNGQDR